MTASDIMALHLTIHGRAQGVFFSDSMCREAQILGVTGRMNNRSDGTEEAAAVEALVRCAHRDPQHAQVERVEIARNDGSYADFRVIG